MRKDVVVVDDQSIEIIGLSSVISCDFPDEWNSIKEEYANFKLLFNAI